MRSADQQQPEEFSSQLNCIGERLHIALSLQSVTIHCYHASLTTDARWARRAQLVPTARASPMPLLVRRATAPPSFPCLSVSRFCYVH